MRRNAPTLRQSHRARPRTHARLPRHRLAVRAAHLRARGRVGRPGTRGLHPGLLPARAGSLHRGHDDEAVAGDQEEPQDAAAAGALSRRAHQDALPARHRGAGRPLRPGAAGMTALAERALRPAPGEVYLPATLLQSRVRELAAAIDRDHRGAPLVLVAVLKGAALFAADLSRAVSVAHRLDTMALSAYSGADPAAGRIRLLKDLDRPVRGQQVVVI